MKDRCSKSEKDRCNRGTRGLMSLEDKMSLERETAGREQTKRRGARGGDWAMSAQSRGPAGRSSERGGRDGGGALAQVNAR